MTITQNQHSSQDPERQASVGMSDLGPRFGHVLPFTITSAGVTMQIDMESEDSWIEVPVENPCALAIAAFEEVALAHGLELDDDVYHDTIDANGNIRIPLLEVIP